MQLLLLFLFLAVENHHFSFSNWFVINPTATVIIIATHDSAIVTVRTTPVPHQELLLLSRVDGRFAERGAQHDEHPSEEHQPVGRQVKNQHGDENGEEWNGACRQPHHNGMTLSQKTTTAEGQKEGEREERKKCDCVRQRHMV